MVAAANAGRPRDPRISDAACAAARELLVEVGYAGMSIDLVARRAGVNRPAMYRRWPTLAHLVHEAVFGANPAAEVAETGDLIVDVSGLARNIFRAYSRPEVQAALAGMVSDLHDHPDLRSTVIDRVEGRIRVQFADLLARAVARGDARAVDADVVLDTINGALFFRVIARQDVSAAFVDDLVELVVTGLRPR